MVVVGFIPKSEWYSNWNFWKLPVDFIPQPILKNVSRVLPIQQASIQQIANMQA